ncbi:MAG: nicotinate-nucleotide diphosphorylase (carboxylating), partial [Phycisphaerae bacterium]
MAIPVGEAELENLRRLLALAKAEDLGGGDVTSRLLPAGLRAAGSFVAREELAFCGGPFLHPIAQEYDAEIRTDVRV